MDESIFYAVARAHKPVFNKLDQIENKMKAQMGVLLAFFAITTLALTPALYRSVAGICALVLLVLATAAIALISHKLMAQIKNNEALAKNNAELEATSGEETHAAMHDPLTGAANRRQFEQRLDELVSEENPSHVLMMLDLDRFKPVNDLYGHAAGDALLKEITAGLHKLVSPKDTVARLGGDEFAILLRSTSPQISDAVALRALEFVIKFRLNWQGQRISVGTSIGIVNIDKPGLSGADLMSVADEALYAAKEAGRGVAFVAIQGEAGSPATFEPIKGSAPAVEPTKSARSHEPEDGRKQELFGCVIAKLGSVPDPVDSRSGSRSRHEVSQWILTEPRTIGDSNSPGMRIREIIDDASARGDGGADLARWMLVHALNSASRFESSDIDRFGFVLPIPAQAVVTVPALAEELMRINALSHQPIRNLKFLLYNLGPVYNAPEIGSFQERLAVSGVGIAYELRSSTLDALAPLHRVDFDEVYLARELSRNLRAGTPAYTALESLLTITKQKQTDVIASAVDTKEEVQHMASMGIRRFAGPFVGEPLVLHDTLEKLQKGTKAAANDKNNDGDQWKKSA